MGCGGPSKLIPINVPVPEHGSGFLTWGDENSLRALEFLLTWHTKADFMESAVYLTPYVVHPDKASAGEAPTPWVGPDGRTTLRSGTEPLCVVTDVRGELAAMAMALHNKMKLRGSPAHHPYRPTLERGFHLTMDMRRLFGVLYMHLPLLIQGVQKQRVAFTSTLDVGWINRHLPFGLLLPPKLCKELVTLFNKMNTGHTGGLTVREFSRWVEKHTADDSEAESVFLDFVFLVNGRPASPGHLDVHEFILAVHSFLTMSHEEMMEHFFACMADTVTEDGHLAINMRKITKRYPKLARANTNQHAGNEMLLTEFKNLAEARNMLIHTGHEVRHVKTRFKGGNLIHNPARDKRFRAPSNKGFDPVRAQYGERHTMAEEGQLCKRAQFIELLQESHYIMGPMYMLQSVMHKQIFGLDFWSERAMAIRKLSGGRSRERTKFLARSVSRQMLHTQNSGLIRLSAATEKVVARAVPEGQMPPPEEPSRRRKKGKVVPAKRVRPTVPAAVGSVAMDADDESKGTDGEEADPDLPPPPPSPDKHTKDVASKYRLLHAHPTVVGAPGDRLRFFQWLHRPDNSFVLKKVKEPRVGEDDETDVTSVLSEMDHDHSRLDAVAGVEPLRKMESLMASSHFPPLKTGMRQRRHTFTLGHKAAPGIYDPSLPPPIHVDPRRVPERQRRGSGGGAHRRGSGSMRRSSGSHRKVGARVQRTGARPHRRSTGTLDRKYTAPAALASYGRGAGAGGATGVGEAGGVPPPPSRPYYAEDAPPQVYDGAEQATPVKRRWSQSKQALGEVPE